VEMVLETVGLVGKGEGDYVGRISGKGNFSSLAWKRGVMHSESSDDDDDDDDDDDELV